MISQERQREHREGVGMLAYSRDIGRLAGTATLDAVNGEAISLGMLQSVI